MITDCAGFKLGVSVRVSFTEDEPDHSIADMLDEEAVRAVGPLREELETEVTRRVLDVLGLTEEQLEELRREKNDRRVATMRAENDGRAMQRDMRG